MRYERGRKPVRILIMLDRILHTKEAPNEMFGAFSHFFRSLSTKYQIQSNPIAINPSKFLKSLGEVQ